MIELWERIINPISLPSWPPPAPPPCQAVCVGDSEELLQHFSWLCWFKGIGKSPRISMGFLVRRYVCRRRSYMLQTMPMRRHVLLRHLWLRKWDGKGLFIWINLVWRDMFNYSYMYGQSPYDWLCCILFGWNGSAQWSNIKMVNQCK